MYRLKNFFNKKTDKKPSSATTIREFSNTYSSSVQVAFKGSVSQDRGFLSRPAFSIHDIAQRFSDGARIQELLIDYYPAEVCDALIDYYHKNKASGMMITLLTELLGSDRASRRIVNQAGFSQDDSDEDDEHEGDDDIETEIKEPVFALFEFDRVASRTELTWGEYVTPYYLEKEENVRSLLSAMIHAIHAEMILDRHTYSPTHAFYDPVAKLINGYTIQQLLFQGVPPAVVMFALEECYDRYPDNFAVILWRSLRLRLDHAAVDVNNPLMGEAILTLRDNPSTSIFELGCTLQELAQYMNVGDEYKKTFFEQVVRACMYMCPFPQNQTLQEQLAAFQNDLHRSSNESMLITNMANLLLLGVSQETIKTMYMNHQFYFLDQYKQNEEISKINVWQKETAENNEEKIDVNQEDNDEAKTDNANEKVESLLRQAFNEATRIFSDSVDTVVTEVKSKGFNVDPPTIDKLCLIIVRSVRLGAYDQVIKSINNPGIVDTIKQLLKEKIEAVFSVESDIKIMKQLSEMGMTSIDDFYSFLLVVFNDVIVSYKRKSQLKNQDFNKELLSYVYDIKTDLSKRILSAGLSPTEFIFPSYQGDTYHDALCGHAEPFRSRSQAEDHSLNFAGFLSEFPMQQRYNIPVKSRENEFFAKQLMLIKLKNFLDSSTIFLTEDSVDQFCREMNMNVSALIGLLESCSDKSPRREHILTLLQGVMTRQNRQFFSRNSSELISGRLLEFGGFDNFLREQDQSTKEEFSSAIVTDCLNSFAQVFQAWLDHFKQALNNYYSSKNAFDYTRALAETKMAHQLLKGFYEKIRTFSRENTKKPEWELVSFLLEAIFSPYAESVFCALKVFHWQQLPTLNFQEYSQVIDYVAKLNDINQFSSGLSCLIAYIDIYRINDPQVYALSAEKILLPILTARDKNKLQAFYAHEEFAHECVSRQISLPTLPLSLLVNLIAQLTGVENSTNELAWLDTQLGDIPFYSSVKLIVKNNRLMALLVLKLFSYQDSAINRDGYGLCLMSENSREFGKIYLKIENNQIKYLTDFTPIDEFMVLKQDDFSKDRALYQELCRKIEQAQLSDISLKCKTELFEITSKRVHAHQNILQIRVSKLLESNLGKALVKLEDHDIVNYVNYLSESDDSSQDGTTIHIILDKYFSLFEKFSLIQTVRNSPNYLNRLAKLLEVYPKLHLLGGLVDHVFDVGAHILFDGENMVFGHASVLEEIITSLLRAEPIVDKKHLRAHYRLCEVFDRNYVVFDLKTPANLQDYRCIYRTLVDISKIEERLSLVELYKYKIILNYLKLTLKSEDELKTIDNVLFKYKQSLEIESKTWARIISHSDIVSNFSDKTGEHKKLREESKKIAGLSVLYQALQNSLYVVSQEDTLYVQLAIKFQLHAFVDILKSLDQLVIELTNKEIDGDLEFCDARARWKKMLMGLIMLSVDDKLYETIRRMIKAHDDYSYEGKELTLYKGLGALFISSDEDDRFDDYASNDRESVFGRVSTFSYNNQQSNSSVSSLGRK